MTVRYSLVDAPAGRAFLAWTDRGVCCAEFAGGMEEPVSRLKAEYAGAEFVPARLADWEEALARLQGPLETGGTAFQRMVWAYLRTIPAGETRSYAQVAAAVGRPGSARAVARACAANRIAVGIPCHRVVAADGSLAGYRWGVERKRELLRLEMETAAAGSQRVQESQKTPKARVMTVSGAPARK